MNLNKFFAILFLFLSLHGIALNEAVKADSAKVAYEKGDYQKAISLYQAIINSNLESSDLYYNLGNAHFKNNEVGLAILYYEKAKKLNPEDDDLLTNLKIANQRIEDKIDAAPELFLNQWQKTILDLMNEKQWSVCLILIFSIALFLIAVYLVSTNRTFKQIGFFGGIVFVILSITGYYIAAKKYDETVNSNEAIIISPSTNANGSPSEKGTKLFILHEGTKVKISEENNDWIEIKIANGNVGWVKASALKKI